MNIEDLKIGQTVYVKGVITDIEKNEILDLEIHTSENNFFVSSSDAIASLDQPKLKIPQFMLDWVDDSREHGYEFDEWFYYSNQPLEVYKWLNTKNKRQKELNALALVTLIVNGPDAVIVEKEKLYTVEIPTLRGKQEGFKKLMIIRGSQGSDNIDLAFVDNPDSVLCRFTEQEIRKDFDWAWQFAKEVTE
ncbi:DUF1642 domain-containing protein [Streptococcus uberis]